MALKILDEIPRGDYFSIELEFFHQSPDSPETSEDYVYTQDTWYGNEEFIEKLAKMLNVYKSLSKRDLQDNNLVQSKLFQIADEIGTNNRDPERLVEALVQALPDNVFHRGMPAQVSKYKIFLYNKQGQKFNVQIPD